MTEERKIFGDLPNEEIEEETEPASEEKALPEVVSVYYEAPPEDTEVIGVKFNSNTKSYYFDPDGEQYPEGCHVIVETARGLEYGLTVQSNHIVSGREIVLPLRKALRIATEEDRLHDLENKEKAKDALNICAAKVAEHGLDMKLIDAEYTFDNSKLLVYFTSDGRVDFRELVKDLAGVFKCRIELRQMGIRDEAKILGGLGTCGRAYCCHAFLPDFVQVSIKMAKEQNLSLNSTKISGACGRLMCCLRYEYDTYLEEGRRTPKVDSLVNTPEGIAVVIETKPLVGMVRVKLLGNEEAAPRVFHRDDLSPIKKGDDNYEKALEEKTLEKVARAKGTTRMALKKAAAEAENPQAEKKERIERPTRPAPKRAAFYTDQVTPSALAPSEGKNALPKEETAQNATPETEKKKDLRQSDRKRNNRRGKGGEKQNAEQPHAEQQKAEKAPRYEKTSRTEQKAAAGNAENRAESKQITPKQRKPIAENPAVHPENGDATAENGENGKKKRHFRPFRKNKK